MQDLPRTQQYLAGLPFILHEIMMAKPNIWKSEPVGSRMRGGRPNWDVTAQTAGLGGGKCSSLIGSHLHLHRNSQQQQQGEEIRTLAHKPWREEDKQQCLLSLKVSHVVISSTFRTNFKRYQWRKVIQSFEKLLQNDYNSSLSESNTCAMNSFDGCCTYSP